MPHWLMKTEPTTYSIQDLAGEPNQTTCWEGVRNYQARNLLRDDIQVGDQVLFYHSACKEPAVTGVAKVSRAGYPDHHAFDKQSHYYDAKSNPDDPTWFMVDVTLDHVFAAPVTLKQLRAEAALAGSVLSDMMLLRKGSRLSVQPVTAKEFKKVVAMSKAKR
ncbi:MAG: EVE domain-containing protein [Planctomycetota bacterium]